MYRSITVLYNTEVLDIVNIQKKISIPADSIILCLVY